MENKILSESGKVYQNNELTVNHMFFACGGNIKSHNHPDEIIFFNLVKGKVKVYLKDIDKGENFEYLLEAPQVLNFDGKNYISADVFEDSEIFVYLLKK